MTDKPIDRGDAVNLARNVRGRDALVITDKGIDMLAEAVLRMDEELTRLYAARPEAADTTHLDEARSIIWHANEEICDALNETPHYGNLDQLQKRMDAWLERDRSTPQEKPR